MQPTRKGIASMTEDEVRKRAFAMPLTSPAYPPGPYRFVNREFLVITYRTDPEKLRALVPAPLEVTDPIVKYEFIRMPDSTGFGDYTETGQVIPVRYQGRAGGYTHCMFLNDHPPIAGGRELWGFPKKLAQPTLKAEIDTLVGTLDWGMSAQDAIALPNVVARGTPIVEPGFDPAIRAALEAMGQQIKQSEAGEASGLHAVMVMPDGRLAGGADPRREGAFGAP